MDHCIPPLRNWWPILNVIFLPVMRLVLDDRKILTTPEIIDQIHELILEDCWISDKLIADQLGIAREWVGSIITKIWTRGIFPELGREMPDRGSKTSTVPVV